jgi:hypothetical protein
MCTTRNPYRTREHIVLTCELVGDVMLAKAAPGYPWWVPLRFAT